MSNPENTCPVCEAAEVFPFYTVKNAPVYCNVMLKTREDAKGMSTGEICLGFCRSCGHIYNTKFDNSLLKYTENYECSLNFSPFFREYARAAARRLIRKHGLYGKDVIEVGCGKGEFLTLICDLGGNRGIGFDSSYSKGRGSILENTDIRFIKDYYSDKYAGMLGDIVCCRHVLEHIERPRNFIQTIKEAAWDGSGSIFFFEVPDASYLVKNTSIYDVIYEHFSHYNRTSLTRLFASSGFDMISIRNAYGGQFLTIEAKASAAPKKSERRRRGLMKFEEEVRRFSGQARKKARNWAMKLAKMRDLGLKTIVWGAGSKGVSFLNFQDSNGFIEYVVDINPNKQGKYVPVSGQLIVRPEFLVEYRPEVILVMNPVYVNEIRKMTKAFGLRPSIVTV